MKNADKPAYPITKEATDRIDSGVSIYTSLTKNELSIYKDAVVARKHNKRISIVKSGDDEFLINSLFADKDADKPACIHACYRGRVRETTVKVTAEFLDSLVTMWTLYKKENQ